MQSLKAKFDELCLRLEQGPRLESMGSDPIFYLVFPVSEIIKVKQETPAWVAKLKNQGWNVVTLSMAETLNSILRRHKFRKMWLVGEKDILAEAERSASGIDFREINKTIAKAITPNGPNDTTDLVEAVKLKIHEATREPRGLLVLTDLEALHPYMRINTIEAGLQGLVRCPIVVLYPGKRDGKTSLRFLEFYPADPNYRSDHIG
jgi:Domain of unknown function (DUF1788)